MSEAFDFLQRWRPGGPWILNAMEPSKRSAPEVRTVTSEAEVEAFLAEWGPTRNIYFSVNPALYPVAKKTQREDIAELAWLHVDLDPRAGENLETERDRILRTLSDPSALGVPLPTCIVFSGGGYQAFWRLAEPFHIGGQPGAYEEAARYNQQLEILFGADHCHNVDRVMRLPGTINRPDEKKRAKGRTETPAKLTEWHTERIYPLSVFTQAPKVQRNSGDGFGGDRVKVSGNLRRFNSVDELPDKVSKKCRVVIVQGHDPDSPTKHESRSEWLWWVCCEMVRAGCDDDTIYSVITDPDFHISASVLGKGRGAERYALRQIERAREEAVDPWLRKMNEQHAVVRNVGGSCRVITEEHDPVLDRTTITYQSINDIKSFYCNRLVDVTVGNKTKSVPLGVWWMDHPQRREYNTVVFSPARDLPGTYNLWRGFAFDAIPGRTHEKFLEHVRENVCGGNDEHFSYLLGWMANAVQKPDSPGHTAVVLRGSQGTGKGFFAKTFGRLFGRHFLQVVDSKHLVGNFNAHLRDCLVLFADEAFYAGDKKNASVLKSLVTEETRAIEAKGVDLQDSANFVHLIMASNESWVVPAGLHERRFFVLDVVDTKRQDLTYFEAIQSELNAGGYASLLHYLMTYDLSKYSIRRVPRTLALRDQQERSFSTEEQWWFEKLRNGEVLQGKSWPKYVWCSELSWDLSQYDRRNGSASIRLGLFLNHAVPRQRGTNWRNRIAGCHDVVHTDGVPRPTDRPWAYTLPSLVECRARWDEKFGGPYDWPDVNEVVNLGEDQF